MLWRGWDGYCPHGMKTVAFISHDKGVTWTDYSEMFNDENPDILYFESKVIELSDGRLLALAWTYNQKEDVDLPNRYSISKDKGKSFGKVISTGISAQTSTPLLLDENKLLVVSRRTDKSGLWAEVIQLEDEKWTILEEYPLWGERQDGLIKDGENISEKFSKLQFGAPFLTRMRNGLIYVAFWCVEDCVASIKWMKIRVTS
jgi:hypothetical protein